MRVGRGRRGVRGGRRKRERARALGGLIPSSEAVDGGTHHGSRSVDGESSTEQLHCSTKKTKLFLQKAPWTLEFFGNFENRTHFALFGTSNLF
jgi:hypothetical protein